MPETKQCKSQVDEDCALSDERQGTHEMLHGDLHHWRHIEVRVVGHYYAIK